MAEKTVELKNKLTLAGILLELEVKETETKEKEKDGRTIPSCKQINVKGKVQFGETRAESRRFEMSAKELKNDGNPSAQYTNILNKVSELVSLADAEGDVEKASKVCVVGEVRESNYVGADNKLHENLVLRGTNFFDYKGSKAEINLDGYIRKVTPEKDKEGEETGRLIVSFVSMDNWNNPLYIKDLILEEEYVSAFSEYEAGVTTMLYINLVNKTVSKPKKQGGFGVQRDDDTTIKYEMSIVGAKPAIQPDEKDALDKEFIKTLLIERKTRLEQIEAEGYKGNQNASTNRNSFGGTRPTANRPSATKPATKAPVQASDDDDEDF